MNDRYVHVLARTIVNLALCNQMLAAREGRPAPAAVQLVRDYVDSLVNDLAPGGALSVEEAHEIVNEALTLV